MISEVVHQYLPLCCPPLPPSPLRLSASSPFALCVCPFLRADLRRRQQEAIDYSRTLQRRLREEKAEADRELNRRQAEVWAKRNAEVRLGHSIDAPIYH